MKNLFSLFFAAFAFTHISAQCWRAYSTDGFHGVVLKTDGTLWTWGQGTEGQLGDGTTTTWKQPIQISADTNWCQFSAGRFLTFALKHDNTLWSWGFNYYGQIGNGNQVNQ